MSVTIDIRSPVGGLKILSRNGMSVVDVPGLGIDDDGPYLRPEGAAPGEEAWLRIIDETTGECSAVLKEA